MLFEDNAFYMTFKVIVIVLGTLGMMCSTTEFKRNYTRNFCALSLYLLYVIISSSAIIHFFGYLFFARICVFTISFPAVLSIYIFARTPLAKTIFIYASQILLSLYACATVTLITTKLHASELADCLMRVLSYLLIIILEFALVRRPFLGLSKNIRNGWGILSLIPCFLIMFVMAFALYPVHYTQSTSTVVLIYLFGIVIVIIYFSIFQYLTIQYQFQMTSHNQELLKLQVQNIREKAAEITAVAEKARIDMHDIRHRLQTIASLMENGETQSALDYISNSISQLRLQKSVLYCNDPILNATLSFYLERAAEENIVLETHFSIPDTLPADSAELSIVFANALENAITACRQLSEHNRKIICKCIQKPKFMLEISNPYTGTITFSKDGIPISNEAEHGIGTRSIMAFCKKNNVFYNFTAEDGWFMVTLVF